MFVPFLVRGAGRCAAAGINALPQSLLTLPAEKNSSLRILGVSALKEGRGRPRISFDLLC
jgi:hypothetical protein